ncbi:aspartic peptidase domain-containing protein [Truncatella angustata]|uniref:Aspartic peptidase domain-containing protein n=1 Tax=Truncatella angustata TaxID=152316 RepID=A0A9P8UXA4_9PEZI|nr:aspartic peptidase domain-containing protein [Truncatella angustata]KAH6661029.1 aspartic peptidase domain-containing protein [Truncatella angustata]
MKVLFFLGLAALVAATPAHIQKRGVYKVERIPNPNYTGTNGPRALLKTLRKYRMPVPAGLMESVEAHEMITKRKDGKGKGQKAAAGNGTNAAAARNGTNAAAAAGTGLVTATPETNDVEYLSPVNIGGQTLNLDFDSGSSDLWVFSNQLSTAATTGHTVFDATKSNTFALMQGATFQISYGDGSGAAGNVGTDTVDIGGATVTQQAVELATAVSKSFVQDTNNNGLLGLAFSKLNTVKPAQQKTFFDNVMPSLAEPLFTADLRANAVGAYEFGRVDNTKFTGQMTWVPINTTQGFWQFSSESFAVNGGQAQQGTSGGQAIADTGTTLILADPTAVSAYYSQVSGAVNDAQAGGFVFPCNTQMPDLQLDVGGTMATVKGSDINFAQVDNTNCFGGVQASPANLFIYGDIFFKSNFVAFNGGNNSLGFATHVVA